MTVETQEDQTEETTTQYVAAGSVGCSSFIIEGGLVPVNAGRIVSFSLTDDGGGGDDDDDNNNP